MNLLRYAVGLYFLWASMTTLVSRFFLNLRAAGSSNSDWVSAGIRPVSRPGQKETEQTRTIGSTPVFRSSRKDDVVTIGYGEGFEMQPRKEYRT